MFGVHIKRSGWLDVVTWLEISQSEHYFFTKYNDSDWLRFNNVTRNQPTGVLPCKSIDTLWLVAGHHVTIYWPIPLLGFGSWCGQCDQIGRFIGLWTTFQSLWQQFICPNVLHSKAIFVKVSKSLILLVKSFLGKFKDIWRFFTGHTASNSGQS